MSIAADLVGGSVISPVRLRNDRVGCELDLKTLAKGSDLGAIGLTLVWVNELVWASLL